MQVLEEYSFSGDKFSYYHTVHAVMQGEPYAKTVKTKCQSNLYKSLIYHFILLHHIITADMQ